MHCPVRAVGAEDRGTHVLLHLLPAQRAWSASARLALQGSSCSIPPLMPPLHRSPSAGYSVASSEGGEGMSGGVGRVLEEDCVFGVWAELLHRGVRWSEKREERQRGIGVVHVRSADFSQEWSVYENEKREWKARSMDE